MKRTFVLLVAALLGADAYSGFLPERLAPRQTERLGPRRSSNRARGRSAVTSYNPTMQMGPPGAPEDEPESLYNPPKLDFDATTVVALLGAAIAFNFFVVANL